MTDIQRWHPTIRMNQAVVHAGLLYTAGQVVDRAAGEGAEAQTAEILRKIDALLVDAGTDKHRVLTASVHLADIADFDAMNRAWDAWVPHDHKPVRTTVEARLTDPAFKVEIGVVAALAPQGLPA
jgi:enamine deaminase RidA (YjgF/YER057c/UK114 family)